jgi:hypothetical protein
MSTSGDQGELDELRRRVDLLERDNQRLREKIEPALGPDNPCFNPRLFMRVLQRNLMLGMIPIYLVTLIITLASIPALGIGKRLQGWWLGPIPVVDVGGMTTGIYGIGLGIIAAGGAGVGVIAMGGLAVGIIAIGGGAVGIVAIGGGSLGIIAIGGGACGWIAVGGGAVGRYTLAFRGYGKHVLALNRQDPEAIALFVQYVPGLRAAVTTAMPVIFIKK